MPTTTGSANNNNQRSIIIVEVIGFGGSDGTTPSQDNAQGRKERDQRSYNTNSPYQILGVGALNDRQISALAAEKRTGSQPAR